MLPPPDDQIVTSLQAMYQSGNWKDLLEASESRIHQFLFWLDLSHWAGEAATQLGYPIINDVIGLECLIYTKRLAGLEKLSFADGTPFASEDSRQWLKRFTSADKDMQMVGGDPIEQLVIKEMIAAEKLLKKKQLDQALASLNKHCSTAVSLRERFFWLLNLGKLFVRANLPSNALPFIEEILSMIDEHNLDKWEPVLAVNALTFALTGFRLAKDKQYDNQIQVLFKRISILDPVKAMELA